MNKEELKNVLPHRDDMLLVDKAEVINDKAIGEYTITGEEFFLKGHFPGNPVVPGVILCEIMAQTCCVLLEEQCRGKTPYLTSLDKVRFKEKVFPGDKLEIECHITKVREPFYFASGKGYINGKLAVSGEYSFALMQE